MDNSKNKLTPLSKHELMQVQGGGPISGPTLILGAFGVASAGIAIGLAIGAAYYYSTR